MSIGLQSCFWTCAWSFVIAENGGSKNACLILPLCRLNEITRNAKVMATVAGIHTHSQKISLLEKGLQEVSLFY